LLTSNELTSNKMKLSKAIIEQYNISIEDGNVIINGHFNDLFFQVEEAKIEEMTSTFVVSNDKASISLFKEINMIHTTIY